MQQNFWNRPNQGFFNIIPTILGEGHEEKNVKEYIKYAEDSDNYIHLRKIEPPSASVCLETLQGSGSGFNSSIKRRFQRNRTSFGAEQIAILERGNNSSIPTFHQYQKIQMNIKIDKNKSILFT